MSGKSRLRSRVGTLDLYKRKAWKPYMFKVTANTYFHYFKDSDMSKSVGQILLADVIKVSPAFPKGGTFAFEVHFRGKGGTPWVLNANTNEDRIQWMDDILPGSSATLAFVQHIAPRPTSPMPQSPAHLSPPGLDPPQANRSPSPVIVPRSTSPVPQSSANRSPSPLPDRPRSPFHKQTRSLLHHRENGVNGVDLSQSWPLDGDQSDPQTSSLEPQEYLMPVPRHRLLQQSRSQPPENLTLQDLNQSQRSNSHRLPQLTSEPPKAKRPTPVKRSTVSSASHKPPEPPPRPIPRTRTAPNLELPELPEKAEEDPYIVMQSSPVPVKSRKFFDPSSKTDTTTFAAEYLTLCPEGELDHCPVDENNYVLATECVKPSKKPNVRSRRQSGDEIREGEVDGREKSNVLLGTVDQMSKSFSPDQLNLLVQMLQQVQAVGGGGRQQTEDEIAAAWEVPPETKSEGEPSTGPQAVVYEATSPVNVRGKLERVLSYAPSLDPYNILITDDDESYEPRPNWAKATTMGGDRGDDGALDTLTALEQEALFIPRNDLDDFEQIGEGQFGKVFKATLRRGIMEVSVAVKTTKKSTSEADKASFVREMSIMSQMMHPNIVRLYGLVSEDVPCPWIVLEFLPHGDLKSFLKTNKRPVTTLCKYMIDVAMGMHYLSERGLVHRDLAARNILVGENELCKVADFGLLRELPKDDSIYHSQTNIPCPVRWMPPEAVTDRAFSTASDVWSFGILQWEMFNPAKLPYDKFSNLECVTKVMQGYRLPVPRDCPSIVARIMKACWHKNPGKRPSFLLISTLLSTKVTFEK